MISQKIIDRFHHKTIDFGTALFWQSLSAVDRAHFKKSAALFGWVQLDPSILGYARVADARLDRDTDISTGSVPASNPL